MKAADAALLLGLGNDLQGERGLARRFRTVNLDDAAARQAADAERDVEAQRAGRDGLDVVGAIVGAEAHDRALAEVLVDLRERRLERFMLVHISPFDHAKLDLIHCGHLMA